MLFLGLVCFYSAYHLVYGNRGLVEWYSVTQKIEETEARLAAMQAEEDQLVARIQRLRPGGIDQDFLDEQMVRVLGYRLNGPKQLIVQSEL